MLHAIFKSIVPTVQPPRQVILYTDVTNSERACKGEEYMSVMKTQICQVFCQSEMYTQFRRMYIFSLVYNNH